MEFRDPIERLMEEHQHGLKELEKMLKAGQELKARGFNQESYETLRGATDFINGDIRTHNQNEENALFPMMEAKMGEGGPTTVMRSEHQQLWAALDKLETELGCLPSTSANGEVIGRVAELSAFIHNLLIQHIYKEDNILYPMAREILTPEEFQQVFKKMVEPLPPSV